MAGTTTRRRAVLAGMVALTMVVVTGCGASNDGGAIEAAGTEGLGADSGPAHPTPQTGVATTDSDAGARSVLERERSTVGSDVERRVSDALSDLGAQARGGDTVITLPETVLFDFDRHALRPDAVETLDDVVEVITYTDPAPVQIHGHTDTRGSTDYNQRLSARRADTVLRYLTGAGVDEGRLTARGFGETRPVAPNEHDDGSDDPEGRARNRRVEIIIEGVDLTDL